MKFALVVSLSLACCYGAASALPPSSVADSRLLLSAKSKPEATVAAAPGKSQQCVYADASKTGRKTIVCGDPAPPTLASLLHAAKPVPAAVADTDDGAQQQRQQSPNPTEARTILEKCFGDKKKQEQTVVYVQQPEYHHEQQHYVAPQPQVQYLQPQIQYVQPQVQLVQPQVHVIQPQPAQVHYVRQQHYVQVPAQVHYVQQQQHPIKSLCQQDLCNYGRSADGYPVQLMRAADVGQTVLMAVDDDDDDDSDSDSVAAARSSSDPTLATVWADEPTVMVRGAIDGSDRRFMPSFRSIFRPAAVAFRSSSDGVQYREYPGDISSDFQQQLSQQQQQVVESGSPLLQYDGSYPMQQQQQQLSYGGGGFYGQMQPSSSSFGGGYPYGTAPTMSRSGMGDFRVPPPTGYLVRPGAMSRGAVAEEQSAGQMMMRSDATKSSLDEQNVRRPTPQSTATGRQMAADPKDAMIPEDNGAKTTVGGNGSKITGYERQLPQ